MIDPDASPTGLHNEMTGLSSGVHNEMLAIEGRLAMRFMEATRLIVFAVLLLMTGVITAVITVSSLG